MTHDPFGTDSVDEFDDATSEYVTIHDLDGRNVLIYPREVQTAQGNNGSYEKIIADVVVLDGPTTELIETVPTVVEDMHLNAKVIVDKLKSKVRKGDTRPTGGQIDSRPSKSNRLVKAYGIQTWTPDNPIRKLANEQAAKYKESDRVKDVAPF